MRECEVRVLPPKAKAILCQRPPHAEGASAEPAHSWLVDEATSHYLEERADRRAVDIFLAKLNEHFPAGFCRDSVVHGWVVTSAVDAPAKLACLRIPAAVFGVDKEATIVCLLDDDCIHGVVCSIRLESVTDASGKPPELRWTCGLHTRNRKENLQEMVKSVRHLVVLLGDSQH